MKVWPPPLHDGRDPWLPTGFEDVMTPPFAGQPGHGSTAFLRNQPVRIVDGRADGGYTGVYELICPGCGDHPYVDYSEVPPRLQRLRGPRTLQATLAAYHKHLGTPLAGENGAASLGLGLGGGFGTPASTLIRICRASLAWVKA